MDIYQIVTDRILKQLEAGAVPWRKTWTAGLPKSMNTGKEYRGVNILLLGMTAHTSRYWITYREALRLGGHVRKGERATPIVYWKWRTPEEMKRQQAKTGKEEVAPCVPFVSAVFNLDQVEDVALPADDVTQGRIHSLASAAQIFDEMPVKPAIDHSATFQPAYSRSTDRVLMPYLSQFENGAEYYATLFHELVHSTGHEKRLNRFKEAGGDFEQRYGFEELVAEFGAAFLCGTAGIKNAETEALQAGYIEEWSRVFQKDNRMLLKAASAAQRAVDYIQGKPSNRQEQEPAREPEAPAAQA